MGHSEAASGMGGVIKTILAFRHGEIPPQRHLRTLNPHLALAGTPFSIPTTIIPWPEGPGPRIAGVNSFGIGGTNAHVVLEAPPAPAGPDARATPITDDGETPHLVVLSARSAKALDDLAGAYGAWIETHPGIAIGDLAAVAATGRTQFPRRLALIASRHDDLRSALSRFAGGDHTAALHVARAEGAGAPRIALLFRAHADLEEGTHPLPAIFRAAREQAAGRFQALTGERLEPRHAEPSLFAFQHGWLELFRSLGVVPHAVLGQGVGEVTAALAAGVVDLDAGIRLATARARVRAGQDAADDDIGALSFKAPRRTWISELTEEVMPPSRPPAADHWRRHARAPADPRRALAALKAIGCDLVIAIGGARDGTESWLDPLGAGKGGRREAFLRTLATLYVQGASLDWRALYPRTGAGIELPSYPFQRIRCWPDPTQIRSYRRGSS
jgi:acyl transferase domain-containing protein